MREQLIELYLFRQSQREAELWAELFMEPWIMEACELDFCRARIPARQAGGGITGMC